MMIILIDYFITSQVFNLVFQGEVVRLVYTRALLNIEKISYSQSSSSQNLQVSNNVYNACILQVCVGRIVSWIMPSYQIRPPIDPSVLSQDPTQVIQNYRETWPSLLSRRVLGLLLGTEKKIGQQLTGATSVTIPETIAGQISSPIKFPSRF